MYYIKCQKLNLFLEVTKFISIYVGIVEETKAAPGRDEEYKHIEEDEYESDSD